MRTRNLTAWVAIALLASAGAASAIDPAARGYGVGEPVKGEGESPALPGSPSLTGGPDGFGYVYIDSNEAGGPAFNFVDISGTGTPLGLGDDGHANISLSFSFPFYGGSYTDIRIGNNGGLLVGVTTGTVSFTNVCPLPSTSGSTAPRISPYWDDIDSDTGNVYHQTFGSCPVTSGGSGQCFIVQWHDRPHFSNTPGHATFQAVLYDSGNILFQYLDTDFSNPSFDFGVSASVGIEDEGQDGTFFLQYSCNQANSIPNSLAILFTIPPIGDLAVTKTGDVALGGPYAYTIEVTNNGPEDQTGVAATDVLPAELIYVGDTCGGDFADGIWDIGALANGASVSCDLIVSLVDPNTCVDVVNTVSVTGDLFDPAGGSTAVNSNAGTNVFQDPSFEDGTPNGFWTEASTNFGTPLCTTGTCGFGGGTGPHSGAWWAWFGGISAFEEGSVSQSVTIPVGSTSLSFWFEAPVCGTGGASDFFEATVDGNQVFYLDSTSGICNVVGYSQQSTDISAYADGGSHTIAFHSVTASGQTTNFFVDDVELLSATTCPGVPIAPPAPNILEIPTLQTTGLVLFGLVLAFAALLLVRRRGIA